MNVPSKPNQATERPVETETSATESIHDPRDMGSVNDLDGLLEERLLGKDEMNLAEFPITLLSDRKDVTLITREVAVRDERLGVMVRRKVTVTGSEQYGLPSSVDNLVLLALIYLTKRANDFRERRIFFTRTELLKVLGWPDSGQSYTRIELSLKRWANVFVLFENAWWDKPRQSFATKGFGIIDDFELNDTSRGLPASMYQSNIAWNEVFFQSLEAGFVRTLDLKILLRLKHPTSQQMYRFLGKHFYYASSVTLDLRTFACEHVGLDRGYKDNGKLKEKLQPALTELEEIGFLAPMPREERYKKVGPKSWTITLQRQPGLRLVEENEPPAVDPQVIGPEPTPLEQELIARGVTAATAAELVVAYPANRVQVKIEAFDWLVQKKDKRISKSPAGYLAESIRKDYAAPRGFESRVERDRRLAAQEEERRRVEAARRKAEEAQRARESGEQARILAYWSALPPDAQARLRVEALASPNLVFMTRQYHRAQTARDQAKSDQYMKMILDSHILRILEEREG